MTRWCASWTMVRVKQSDPCAYSARHRNLTRLRGRVFASRNFYNRVNRVTWWIVSALQHYYLFYTGQTRTPTNIWMLSLMKEGTTALFPGQNDSNWQWWKWHVIGHDLIIFCTMLWCRLKLRVLVYRSHSADSVQVPLQHCSVSVGFSRETEVTGIKCLKI